jgi:hypothetical protein
MSLYGMTENGSTKWYSRQRIAVTTYKESNNHQEEKMNTPSFQSYTVQNIINFSFYHYSLFPFIFFH